MRRRLGRVETRRSLITLGNCLVGAVPAVGVVLVLRALTDLTGVGGAWLDLVLTTVIVGVVMGLTLVALRTPELADVLKPSGPGGPILARLRRVSQSAGPPKP